MRTAVSLVIAAPVDRVWRALTVPAEVERWAGVTAHEVPPGYPRAGQHARWDDRGIMLHDYIVTVVPERLLASRLTRGSDLVVERYDLRPAGGSATGLRATWLGHPGLAENATSLHLLQRWCETGR